MAKNTYCQFLDNHATHIGFKDRTEVFKTIWRTKTAQDCCHDSRVMLIFLSAILGIQDHVSPIFGKIGGSLLPVSTNSDKSVSVHYDYVRIYMLVDSTKAMEDWAIAQVRSYYKRLKVAEIPNGFVFTITKRAKRPARDYKAKRQMKLMKKYYKKWLSQIRNQI